MRFLLLYVLIFFAGGLAQAKVKQTRFDGRLISYGQLMRLSPQKRIAYLQDVAALLVQMEKSQHIYEVADGDTLRLKDQVASLIEVMSLLPNAQAQLGASGAQSGAQAEYDCGDNLIWSPFSRNCVSPEKLEEQKAKRAKEDGERAAERARKNAKTDQKIGSGHIGPDGLPIGTPRKGLPGAQSGPEAEYDCGKNLKWSYHSHNCVSPEILADQEAKHEKYAAERAAERAKEEAERAAEQARKEAKKNQKIGSGDIGPDGLPIGTPRKGLPGAQSGAEIDCGESLKWSRYSQTCVSPEILADQQERRAKEEGNRAATKTGESERPSGSWTPVIGSGQIGPDGQMIGMPREGLKGGPSGPSATKTETAKETTPAPTKGGSDLQSTGGEPPKDVDKPTQVQCEKPNLSCTDLDGPARESAIAEFRSDRSTNVCIAGGYFSNYETPKKAVGKCLVQTQFERVGKKPISCPQPKEKGKPRVAMCNPAVFCLGLKVDAKLNELLKSDADVKKMVSDSVLNSAATVSDSKEKVLPLHLCAPVGQDLTEQCNNSLKDHLEGRASRFGKSRGENYVACDSSKLTEFPLQNEYATLRAGVEEKYKAQCNNGQPKFTALFCTECKIIGERIYGMNEKATGQGCATDAPAGATDGGAPGSPQGVREKAGG